MLTQIIIYFILILTAFGMAIILNRNFEETIPLVFFSIVFLIFVSGLLGNLIIGFYLFLMMSIALLAKAVFTIRNNYELLIKKVLPSIITPAFIVFTICYICASIVNVGRIPWASDEFSAWASSAKIMTFWDKLSTIKEANLLAANYPPGMACFQYFVQKVNILLCDSEFSDWRLYFSYQIFTYAILLPFLKGLRHNNFWDNILLLLLSFFTPLFILDHLFMVIYIDTFLGVLFGVGIAFACFWREIDKYYQALLSSIMAMLVLCKPVGVFFAIVVAIFMLARVYYSNSNKMLLFLFIAALSIAIPYVLWQLNVWLSECNVMLKNDFDYIDFFKVLQGKGDGLRTAIFNAFIAQLSVPLFPIYNFQEIFVSIPVVLAFLYVINYLIARKIHRLNPTALKWYRIDIVYFISFFIYMVGLLLVYLYKIVDVTLHSYFRYVGIYLTGMMVCVTCGFTMIYPKRKGNISSEVIIMCVLLLLGPRNDVVGYFSDHVYVKGHQYKTYQEYTHEVDAMYANLVKKYNGIFRKSYNRVFLLHRKGRIDEYYAPDASLHLYYSILPSVIDNRNLAWNVNQDMFDICTMSTDIQAKLISHYDIFLIFTVDDYFRNNFSSLFSDPSTIADQTIYRVNKETGLLDLVTENADT